jgi:hypothetical protein
MGVHAMMLPFFALHALAAQRGEGLRPELISLLERSKANSEQSGSDLAQPGTDLLREDVQWFLTFG